MHLKRYLNPSGNVALIYRFKILATFKELDEEETLLFEEELAEAQFHPQNKTTEFGRPLERPATNPIIQVFEKRYSRSLPTGSSRVHYGF